MADDSANTPTPNESAPQPSATSAADAEAKAKREAVFWEILGLSVVAVGGALVLGVLAVLVTWRLETVEAQRKQDVAGKEKKSTPVVVTVIEGERIEDAINLPGRIEPWRGVHIPAEVAGQVIQTATTPVKDGAWVEEGQPILHIDPKDYELSLEDAKAALVLARQNLARTKELLRKGVRTPSDLDRDESEYNRAQTAFDAAKLALERCTIRSPIHGIVDDVIPEVGEYIQTGTECAALLEVEKVKIEIGIPEKDVDAVRSIQSQGSTVPVRIDSIRTETGAPLVVNAKCSYLSYTPFQQAYVYIMRLELDNPEKRLRPGMFAEARLVRRVTEGGVVAPLFAVLARGDDHYVYIAAPLNGAPDAPPIAKLRKVQLGAMLNDRVEIREGLAVGDRLIVLGQRQVAAEQPVRIVKTIQTMAELRR